MSNIAENLTDLVGNTPLLSLSRYAGQKNAGAKIIAKIEYLSPLFSVKDRVGIAMIKDAEKKLGDSGRVLVRYSGTQLMCRVMVEGPSQEITEKLAKTIAAAVKAKLG